METTVLSSAESRQESEERWPSRADRHLPPASELPSHDNAPRAAVRTESVNENSEVTC
jgi:hypothetical protein